MSEKKEALKARLLAKYEAQLDELFEELEGKGSLDLTEIENQALSIRQQVGQTLTETLAVAESQNQAVDEACPECGKRMRYKGRKEKWLKTRTGDIRVERPYYYCEDCKSGHFPPG